MGDQFLIDLPEEGDKADKPSPPLSYTDIFEKHFPYYLAIGMTPDDYWNGDNDLVKAYREADRIKQDRMNHEKWLQGAYIYEALCAASPLLNGFSKRGKPYPYAKEPYKAPERETTRSNVEKEKQEMLENKAKFEIMMKRINAKFERKEVNKNG
jgi:hypothetical protein